MGERTTKRWQQGRKVRIKKNSGKRSGDFVLIRSTDNDRSAVGYGKRGKSAAKGSNRSGGGGPGTRRWGGFQADWLAWQKLPKSEARYVQHANTRLEIIFVINCTS